MRDEKAQNRIINFTSVPGLPRRARGSRTTAAAKMGIGRAELLRGSIERILGQVRGVKVKTI